MLCTYKQGCHHTLQMMKHNLQQINTVKSRCDVKQELLLFVFSRKREQIFRYQMGTGTKKFIKTGIIYIYIVICMLSCLIFFWSRMMRFDCECMCFHYTFIARTHECIELSIESQELVSCL